jgi:hypothetical protein
MIKSGHFIVDTLYTHEDEKFDFYEPTDPKDICGEMLHLFTKFTQGCVTVPDNAKPGWKCMQVSQVTSVNDI